MSAFSISDIVPIKRGGQEKSANGGASGGLEAWENKREQYMSLRFSGINCWYATMRDRRDTVFPVPEGISSTQCPPASKVSVASGNARRVSQSVGG